MAEIVLGKRSTDFMNDVFSRYTPIARIPERIEEKIVVHMYPTEDTTPDSQVDDGDGGYIDALFFDAKIYFTVSHTVYTLRRRDGINIECPSEVKIFKDGSTMVVVNGRGNWPLLIGTGQSMSIWRRDERF